LPRRRRAAHDGCPTEGAAHRDGLVDAGRRSGLTRARLSSSCTPISAPTGSALNGRSESSRFDSRRRNPFPTPGLARHRCAVESRTADVPESPGHRSGRRCRLGGEVFVAEVVHGSGTLVRWLLDNELVDEITLLVCPVVVGQGTRLFPDNGRDLALDLVESRAFPKGITLQVYRPAGRPQYAID